MNTCAICNKKFEAESPAILFVSRYGVKRPLCAECEALLDVATAEEDSTEKNEARAALSDLALSMKDPDAIATLRGVLDGEFSAEEEPENAEEAFSEEEEDEEQNQEEESEGKKRNVFWDIIAPILIGVWALGLAIWFFFFR